MARSFLVIALMPLFLVAAAVAEPSPASSPGKAASPCPSQGACPDKEAASCDAGSKRRPPGAPADDDAPFKRFKQRIEQMGPAEREQFKENWKRWSGMGDRERKDWQQRAAEEQDRLKKCIDEAIAKTGITLTADQREVFTLRYRQERRKVEEALRKEMDAERQQKVDEMLVRLKAEFSAKPDGSPSPAPRAAATP